MFYFVLQAGLIQFIVLGSSPAQASVAPIAHEKEESRLCCGKDKSVSLSDTRLKEPVVRLKRLSAEVCFLMCSICCVKRSVIKQ
jgi:hypothetical protein